MHLVPKILLNISCTLFINRSCVFIELFLISCNLLYGLFGNVNLKTPYSLFIINSAKYLIVLSILKEEKLL